MRSQSSLFPGERKQKKREFAARSVRFLPFVFTPTHRFIFLNDSTVFSLKDKKITVIHLWHFHSIIGTKQMAFGAVSNLSSSWMFSLSSQRCICRGFNSCLFKLLRASGGCVPLNISWATRLVEREVMWRAKMEWLRAKKEERGDSRWWWTWVELWKDHDDRSRLSPVSPFLPATTIEWIRLKRLHSRKSLGTFRSLGAQICTCNYLMYNVILQDCTRTHFHPLSYLVECLTRIVQSCSFTFRRLPSRAFHWWTHYILNRKTRQMISAFILFMLMFWKGHSCGFSISSKWHV